ncbi:MAG: sugar transferase [Lachnospiraceae bacterium]|nr:sugar transferase [Lachnospiraceae bacterium]MCI9623650.1 sugar transferase [Lachnospiraceae bacterium]
MGLVKKVEFLNWEELPAFMQTKEVRPYWEILKHRKYSLRIKYIFDFITAFILLVFLAIPMLFIAAAIKSDSQGPVFYRQIRVTTYGKKFRIHKFRTMVNGADKAGAAVTAANDSRVTKVGAVLRKYRLDELPQLLDVLSGDMSFVGTRPEVVKYVKKYTPEMRATLLLPAGITSEASIRYKDENQLLNEADDIEKVYVEKIMPAKMKWNLEGVRQFSFLRDIRTMIRTILAVAGKNYR